MTIHRPESAEALALLLRDAAGTGRRLGIQGQGDPDNGAAEAISTSGFDRITGLSGGDLVATVGSGVTVAELSNAAGEAGVWAAWDPPGERRSVGSVVAAASDGPLSLGFGPVRDQLLGLTMVTWAGRVVTVGGRVMKNVAGFDLTRLCCGSFGALGIITSVNLRLRPAPPVDVVITSSVDPATGLTGMRSLWQAGLSPASLELVRPSAGRDRWLFAVRLTGSAASVAADREVCDRSCESDWREEGHDAWAGMHRTGTVGLRIGSPLSGLPEVLDLVTGILPPGEISAGPTGLRWSGEVGVAALKDIRTRTNDMGCPTTLEWAPRPMREEVGTFAGLDHGSAVVLGRLRAAFDPYDTFVDGASLVVD